MVCNDLVRVKDGEVSAGQTGVIIEVSKGYANVYWSGGKVYWIETNKIEVIGKNVEREDSV